MLLSNTYCHDCLTRTSKTLLHSFCNLSVIACITKPCRQVMSFGAPGFPWASLQLQGSLSMTTTGRSWYLLPITFLHSAQGYVMGFGFLLQWAASRVCLCTATLLQKRAGMQKASICQGSHQASSITRAGSAMPSDGRNFICKPSGFT